MKLSRYFFIIFFTQAIMLAACATQIPFDNEKYQISHKIYNETFSEQVSLNMFIEEFFYTNSIEDYFLALEKIKKKGGFKFSGDQKSRLFHVVDNETQEDIKRLTTQLSIDANRKTKDKFYITLRTLEIYAVTLRNAVLIELLLVDAQREVASKLGPSAINVNKSAEFIQLIEHARYRIFSVMLMNEKKRAD